MIIWRNHDEHTPPAWLNGLTDVQFKNSHCWRGPCGVVPVFPTDGWVKVSDGWEAAIVDDIDPMSYVRDMSAACPLVVQDSSERQWILPSILSPEGFPATCQKRVLTDSGWKRAQVSTEMENAVQACEWWRGVRDSGNIDLDQQSDAIVSVLEVSYHIDALTFAKLGLIDDVLASKGLDIAAGVMTHGPS